MVRSAVSLASDRVLRLLTVCCSWCRQNSAHFELHLSRLQSAGASAHSIHSVPDLAVRQVPRQLPEITLPAQVPTTTPNQS